MSKSLVILGFGYSARAIAAAARAGGWRVAGTTRGAPEAVEAAGAEALIWGTATMHEALARADAVLSSVAPGPQGDPALPFMEGLRPGWAGYLSSTAVYGDAGGAWVDEDSPTDPASARGRARLAAEGAWRDWGARQGVGVHVFRLAGIYGPGRSAFDRLREGAARRIVKPGQVFSRIHVEDIAGAVMAALAAPKAGGAVWNVADDAPAPPQDVIEDAARMAGLPVPEAEDFATAEMSPAARAFYDDSRRISNARIKADLDWHPRYAHHRTGLAAILAAGG